MKERDESITEIAEKILALRRFTGKSGFQTSRSQHEILGRLSPDVLAEVLMQIERSEGTINAKK
jgi:hypothetical protein